MFVSMFVYCQYKSNLTDFDDILYSVSNGSGTKIIHSNRTFKALNHPSNTNPKLVQTEEQKFQIKISGKSAPKGQQIYVKAVILLQI